MISKHKEENKMSNMSRIYRTHIHINQHLLATNICVLSDHTVVCLYLVHLEEDHSLSNSQFSLKVSTRPQPTAAQLSTRSWDKNRRDSGSSYVHTGMSDIQVRKPRCATLILIHSLLLLFSFILIREYMSHIYIKHSI